MVEEVATSAVAANTQKVYTLAECKEHSSEKDCWLVIHGKVYNVTEFLDEHPGALRWRG
jgi:cytochrome b involved in lipid metabolism